MPRSACASEARVCVVLFVTNRRRCPAARRRRTASAPPAIGSPETWKTPSTSSRIAAMDGESIRVTRSVVLPLAEIELRFSRSSGPGGQHAQKSETRVEAVFDVERSSALTDAQKRRVLARTGPVLRAVAQDERSQLRNRELAVERLVEQLRAALRVKRPRVPTKPTASSRERRLAEKRRRSQTKRLRRPAEDD
jgi:ribosome-associated protein